MKLGAIFVFLVLAAVAFQNCGETSNRGSDASEEAWQGQMAFDSQFVAQAQFKTSDGSFSLSESKFPSFLQNPVSCSPNGFPLVSGNDLKADTDLKSGNLEVCIHYENGRVARTAIEEFILAGDTSNLDVLCEADPNIALRWIRFSNDRPAVGGFVDCRNKDDFMNLDKCGPQSIEAIIIYQFAENEDHIPLNHLVVERN